MSAAIKPGAWFRKLSKYSTRLLLPPVCVSRKCGRFRAFGLPLCLNCMRELNFADNKVCWECGEADCVGPSSHKNLILSQCYYLFIMTPLLSELIHGLKYHGHFSHANFLMLFYQRQADLKEKLEMFDVVIPVPIHFTRRRDRGYNQSEYIARPLENMGLEVETQWLLRVKNTDTQTKLDRKGRQHNLATAFKVPAPGKIKGKKILLVDDVITTGATLRACAGALLENGAAEVGAFSLARVFKEVPEGDFTEEWDSVGPLFT